MGTFEIDLNLARARRAATRRFLECDAGLQPMIAFGTALSTSGKKVSNHALHRVENAWIADRASEYLTPASSSDSKWNSMSCVVPRF